MTRRCIACGSDIAERVALCPVCRTRQDASECPVCGSFAKPIPYLRVIRYFIVWVILLLMYLLPGFIYWLLKRKKICCPVCGHAYE
ncbi:MAG: hypothetical protein ACYS9X_03315 [Planctomycetota bacterium]|jgi:hypothetical protein